jgi:hypothetical protein
MPSVPLEPVATVANPDESAARHCNVTSRPDEHPGSPFTEPDTTTGCPKPTSGEETPSVVAAVSASASGAMSSAHSSASSASAAVRRRILKEVRASIGTPLRSGGGF